MPREYYMLKQNDGRIYADKRAKKLYIGKRVKLQPALLLKIQEEGYTVGVEE
jgi:hypothetical protein